MHGSVLHLEVGQPDFATPPAVVEAACEHLRAGKTQYTPNEGVKELRTSAAAAFARDTGVATAPEQVLVTPGAAMAIATAFQALLATVSESSSISSSCGDGSGNINLQQQQRGASSIQRGVDLRTMVVGSQLYVFCSVFFFLFLFVRDVSSLSFDLLLSVCIL